MNKSNRANITPVLKRYKYFFDLLKRTTESYLFMIDLQENVGVFSPNFAQDFDVAGEIIEVHTEYAKELLHPDDVEAYESYVESYRRTGKPADFTLEVRLKDRSGEYVWIQIHGRVGMSRDGKPELYVGFLRRLARRNRADAITGLLNKYQFAEAVRSALDEYRATGKGGAIMVLGLDDFKIFNETYNRLAGDQILKYVAKRLEMMLDSSQDLYKLDGDEFAILYKGATEEDIGKLYIAIQSTLAQPMDIENHQLFCTASAGTVFYPQAGKDYLVLHKHAEAALDMAKREGKNRNCLFSKDQFNRWVRSISMRDLIRDSVEAGCEGFQLFYQPQVNATDQSVIGAEALLRWKNPKGKMVAPMEFVPILEETKLIIPVGKWIIDEGLKTCKKWREYIPDFRMSINMSYEQVKDHTFSSYVMDAIKRIGLPPDALTLELTESKIVADWSYVNKRFDAFRESGIRIAMDDFGTGYSSLASLKYLSCDIVKIDREFVKKILENEFDRQLVENVVALCHSIGIKTCIEGVEEEAEYELLTKRCKADSIQGYLFGRPESAFNFEKKFMGLHEDEPEERP